MPRSGTPLKWLSRTWPAIRQASEFPCRSTALTRKQSSGNSTYHAPHRQSDQALLPLVSNLLSSYTWSHSIDDSTDLQSTLEPQDSRFPFLERGNSDNDQRHRWVTSAVFQTGEGQRRRKHRGGISLGGHHLCSHRRSFLPAGRSTSSPARTRASILGASQARPPSAAARLHRSFRASPSPPQISA